MSSHFNNDYLLGLDLKGNRDQKGTSSQFLHVRNTVHNLETSSLRNFSTSSSIDTASIRSNLTDLNLDDDEFDLMYDETSDGTIDNINSPTNTNAMPNFLLLDRLNKKQQLRQREKLARLKYQQQQKINELKQRQQDLEMKATSQQQLRQSSLYTNTTPTSPEATSPVYLSPNRALNQNRFSAVSTSSSLLGIDQSQQLSPQQQQHQNVYNSANNLSPSPGSGFQLKWQYQPATSSQLVQYNNVPGLVNQYQSPRPQSFILNSPSPAPVINNTTKLTNTNQEFSSTKLLANYYVSSQVLFFFCLLLFKTRQNHHF